MAGGRYQKTLIVYVKHQFLGPVIINFTFEVNHYLGSLDRNGEMGKTLNCYKPLEQSIKFLLKVDEKSCFLFINLLAELRFLLVVTFLLS